MARARLGVGGKLVDFGKQKEVDAELGLELLEFVDDVLDDLGSRKAVEYVKRFSRMAQAPTGSYESSHNRDLRAVVVNLVAETRGRGGFCRPLIPGLGIRRERQAGSLLSRRK